VLLVKGDALLLSAGLELHIRFANPRFRRFGHVWLANSKPLGIARAWVAADLTAGAAEPEGTERLQVQLVPFADALAMTADGRITDALAMVAP